MYKLLGIIVLVSSQLLAQETCNRLEADSANHLSNYLRDKLKIPGSVELHSAAFVGTTCYQRLHFTSSQLSQLSIVMFLSPDGRFLTRDLFDTTVDVETDLAREKAELKATLTDGDFPVRGSPDASVTITIFSDFQCPYCRMQTEFFNKNPDLLKEIRLVFRNLPLPIHSWARTSAEMGRCIYLQSNDAFWALHDLLFQEQEKIMDNLLTEKLHDFVASRKDVDAVPYERCVANHETAEFIERDVQFARDHNIGGTPTLFINEIRKEGALDARELRELIRIVSK